MVWKTEVTPHNDGTCRKTMLKQHTALLLALFLLLNRVFDDVLLNSQPKSWKIKVFFFHVSTKKPSHTLIFILFLSEDKSRSCGHALIQSRRGDSLLSVPANPQNYDLCCSQDISDNSDFALLKMWGRAFFRTDSLLCIYDIIYRE